MSITDHQGQYHDFADKLATAKKSVELDESLRYAAEENNSIREELKTLEDANIFKNLLMGYGIIGGLVFLIHILLEGYWVGILGLIAIAVFYFASKISVDRDIKRVNDIIQEKNDISLLNEVELARLKMGTDAIIYLKIKRFQLIMGMTVVLTPLIFMAISELIFGTLSLLNIGLSILIGSLFWMIYFKADIDQLTNMKERLSKTN